MNNSSANMSGVYNIMPTPFNEDETIDLQSLKSVTEFMLTSGVHGITVLGVLGEAHKLTDAERDVVLSTCLLYTSPSPRDQRGSRMPSSA